VCSGPGAPASRPRPDAGLVRSTTVSSTGSVIRRRKNDDTGRDDRADQHTPPASTTNLPTRAAGCRSQSSRPCHHGDPDRDRASAPSSTGPMAWSCSARSDPQPRVLTMRCTTTGCSRSSAELTTVPHRRRRARSRHGNGRRAGSPGGAARGSPRPGWSLGSAIAQAAYAVAARAATELLTSGTCDSVAGGIAYDTMNDAITAAQDGAQRCRPVEMESRADAGAWLGISGGGL
jgi:hypothetical protein